MSAATPEMVREESILTPAQDEQMQRIDQNGDGVISKKEARAEARFAAEQIAKLSFWKMAALGIAALLFLSWIGNAGLTAAVVFLSKDLTVEGGALKGMNGASISTLGQKAVYEATLGSGGTNENSTVMAQVACASVLEAISSIEKGVDGSLVKMNVGDGEVWEPRASAANYELHENSFGIEQIYLDDQRDVSYDVTCEISQADCENAPDSLCDAVESSEVMYSGANDGSLRRRPLVEAYGINAHASSSGYRGSVERLESLYSRVSVFAGKESSRVITQ